MGSVRQEEDPLFVEHPLNLEDAGVKVVVPALAALFAEASLHELGYEGPALGTVLFDELSYKIILLFCPRFLA